MLSLTMVALVVGRVTILRVVGRDPRQTQDEIVLTVSTSGVSVSDSVKTQRWGSLGTDLRTEANGADCV